MLFFDEILLIENIWLVVLFCILLLFKRGNIENDPCVSDDEVAKDNGRCSLGDERVTETVNFEKVSLFRAEIICGISDDNLSWLEDGLAANWLVVMTSSCIWRVVDSMRLFDDKAPVGYMTLVTTAAGDKLSHDDTNGGTRFVDDKLAEKPNGDDMTSFCATELKCKGLDDNIDKDSIWLLNTPSITADLSWGGINEYKDTLDKDPAKWLVVVISSCSRRVVDSMLVFDDKPAVGYITLVTTKLSHDDTNGGTRFVGDKLVEKPIGDDMTFSSATELNCKGLDDNLDKGAIWLLNVPSDTADLSWEDISECKDTLDEDPDKEYICVVLTFLPNAELKFRGFDGGLRCSDDELIKGSISTVNDSCLSAELV